MELKFDYGKLEFSHNRDPNTHIDKNANDLELTLEKDVISDNMQERLEKAFVHLIKLHGGTAKVYKEPF